MSDVVYLTKEKRNELEDELNHLKSVGRINMAKQIAEARAHGDLSENADYDAAKDAQALMELKISKLSSTLAKSQVITASEFPDGKVFILSNVKLKNLGNGDELDYLLVSDEEADFLEDKLSVVSPIGKALMGKSIGDVVEVHLPIGVQKFEILDITK